jgi:hypothetical protein
MIAENEEKIADAALTAAKAFDRLVTLLERAWGHAETEIKKRRDELNEHRPRR